MSSGGFKRWLYRGGRPNLLARALNRGWAIVHAIGVAPDWLVTLEVTGRRSGRKISFPLVLAKVDSERYLVSMLGVNAAWVRNVQAAGGVAVMRHGRTEHIRLEAVPVAQRAPVLKAYLKIAPGARPHIPVAPNAPLAAFDAIAARYPVYRIVVDARAVENTSPQ